MARAGIFKTDVLRARNALVARGRHPSMDAIRIELGNTGSKGTIHRYLKEIEEEEAGTSPTVKASDAILDLTSRLAERLEQEAAVRLQQAEARHAETVASLEATNRQLQQELATLRTQLGRTEAALAQEQTAHLGASEQLSRLTLELAQLSTHAKGLEERLAEKQAHGASLEEKHQHAREALEHFRSAAKEQRERELRQHEQQVQFLQAELAKANEAATGKQLELRAALQDKVDTLAQLQAARLEARALEERVRELKPLRDQLASQSQLIEQLRAQSMQQAERLEELRSRNQVLEQRNTELERQTAAAAAAGQTHEEFVAVVLAKLSEAAKAQPSTT